MPMPLNVVLMRHGTSKENQAHREFRRTGSTVALNRLRKTHTFNCDLETEGFEQCALNGPYLSELFPNGFHRRIVSPLRRARQSASTLSQVTNVTPYEQRWELDLRVCERNWGHLAAVALPNLTPLRRLWWMMFHPALLRDINRMDRDGIFWKPLGGESLHEIATGRLLNFFESLQRENANDDVLVVCHGEIMFLARLMIEHLSIDHYLESFGRIDPNKRIRNAMLLHYTRVNPETGEISPHLDWMRMTCVWDESYNPAGWQQIVRPRYTDGELLALS